MHKIEKICGKIDGLNEIEGYDKQSKPIIDNSAIDVKPYI